MVFVYQQLTGKIWSPKGGCLGQGYSGCGTGKNNPDKQHKKNVGPIPQGLWSIDGHYHSKSKGPLTIILNQSRHDALGRTYFRIHGDSIKNPGSASLGCIILPRSVRQRIVEITESSKTPQYLMVIE